MDTSAVTVPTAVVDGHEGKRHRHPKIYRHRRNNQIENVAPTNIVTTTTTDGNSVANTVPQIPIDRPKKKKHQ